MTPASAVGKYTSVTSKSKAKNALLNRRKTRSQSDTSRRIMKAKSQSLLSSAESCEAAKLYFRFFAFPFEKRGQRNVHARSVRQSSSDADGENTFLKLQFAEFNRGP